MLVRCYGVAFRTSDLSLVLEIVQVFNHQVGSLVDPFASGSDGGRAARILTQAANEINLVASMILILHSRRRRSVIVDFRLGRQGLFV